MTPGQADVLARLMASIEQAAQLDQAGIETMPGDHRQEERRLRCVDPGCQRFSHSTGIQARDLLARPGAAACVMGRPPPADG